VLAGLTHLAADVRDRFEFGLHLDRIARAPFHYDDDTREITDLQPEATRAGVIKGATLESLDGKPYTGRMQWASLVDKPGDVLRVGFRLPSGALRIGSIVLVPTQAGVETPVGVAQVLQSFALFDLMPLICMLIGYWVVFAKPTEPNAWLLMGLLIFPEVVFSMGTGLASGWWLLFRGTYYEVLQIFGPLMLLPFAIYFPERSRLDVRLPWVKWAVIGPCLFAAVIDFRMQYGQYFLAGNPPSLLALDNKFTAPMENFLNLLCVVLYLVILFDKLRSASTEDARRRLRVLLTGTGGGLGALLFVFVLLPHLGFDRDKAGHIWVAYVGAILFLLAPLTLAYVVMVQRAMDVTILIRQGTKYALAKVSIIALQTTLFGYVSYSLLLPILRQRQIQREQLAEAALLLLLIVPLRIFLHKRSAGWIDKKFFREAYDADQVLSTLADEVRKYTDRGPLLETVSKCVADTLHVGRIGMLMQAGSEFKLEQAIGMSSNNLCFAANSSTIYNLNRNRSPAQLYRDDPEGWYLLATANERRALDDLSAEVLLPLPGRNRLMGVMTLGPKQSEAAYSKSDLKLLQVLAERTGLALEISELAHSLADEAALRERSSRELEIAHEVQERFFPQQMPQMPGISVAGHCRPAQGVGGDYYDVFLLHDGRLGIAIGDVSGKGISAALLMASLRASLRGVTLDTGQPFAITMDKVNRLVYEASADNRYATFFFGALDPATRVLECVNAGHNAPLVVRHKPGGETEVLRLEADGPVVGLLPFAAYSEQRLQLEAGDILLCYTDGISEAMTHEDEEWGEERMVAAVAAAPDRKAESVLKTVLAEADRFTAGAPQHDDMTVLVLALDS
jgi:sigma-B regulation protein RsbU (phosphoserine phosphatase)